MSHIPAPASADAHTHSCMSPPIVRQVVPKLNWSCPSDATWVNPLASLACTNADEVRAARMHAALDCIYQELCDLPCCCNPARCACMHQSLRNHLSSCGAHACDGLNFGMCTCNMQVVLMLKSSDRVAHDLELLSRTQGSTSDTSATATTPVDGAPATDPTTTTTTASSQASSPSAAASIPQVPALQPTLVLRKWYDLRPEREWRCFVRGDALVGVCQRDATQHFPQLTANTAVDSEDESDYDSDGSSESGSQAGSQPDGQLEADTGAAEVQAVLSAEAKHAGVKLKEFFERRLQGHFHLQDCECGLCVGLG